MVMIQHVMVCSAKHDHIARYMYVGVHIWQARPLLFLLLSVIFNKLSVLAAMANTSCVSIVLLLIVKSCQSQSSCDESECRANLTRVNCKCDNDCGLYNDCCLDYTLTNQSRPSYLHQLLECQDMVTINKTDLLFHSSVLMVSRCPSEMNNSQCSNQSLFLPVTDPRSNFTFRNIYCALCNNITREEVVLWEPQFYCPDITVTCLHNITYYDTVLKECDLLTISTDLPFSQIRTCVPHISTCSNTSSSELEHNCTSKPVNLVVDRTLDDEKVYRNHYCALCNGASSTLCWIKFPPEIFVLSKLH